MWKSNFSLYQYNLDETQIKLQLFSKAVHKIENGYTLL